MDYTQMTAPCSLDCFNCPLYLANDTEKIQMPLPDAACNGCRTEAGVISVLKRTEPCQVFKCIFQKGLKFCFEYSTFSCDHLLPHADMASQRPHNTKIFDLCLIKKMGIEHWTGKKAKSVRETYFKEKFHL